MQIDPLAPDLAATIALDRFAPRAARFQVGEVDSPSPDLRDAVKLLTSEIVSRAVEHCLEAQAPPRAELRVWMPPKVVRVELRAPVAVLPADASELAPRNFDLMLLDCIADRWSIEHDNDGACFWFEIDRQAASAKGDQATSKPGRARPATHAGR
jgi:hypothetical protein